ncbi:MAG: SH3 domain-containing protein [Spirochaetales bacterium]|nr:SH3 domain-containing protein [Spirochaetales bacterium]
MRKSKTGIAFLIIPFLLILSGCPGEEEKVVLDIPLHSTPAIRLETSWAIITSSHLRLRSEPSLESEAVSLLYRGYIMEILSQTPFTEVVEEKDDYWYRISYDGLQGWVFGGYLEIYNSRDDAERASLESRS